MGNFNHAPAAACLAATNKPLRTLLEGDGPINFKSIKALPIQACILYFPKAVRECYILLSSAVRDISKGG